ncbi:MAG: helix-turn-helix domain-containing protein [Actinomycetota bacterium]|nr:helix-turn-helix domain-containing protein [Actinomycetota bacterium]
MLSARDVLVAARRTAGLTQAQLGERLGRSRSTVARWELGEMEPSYAAGLLPLRDRADARAAPARVFTPARW